jgi:hypothetical protein
MLSIEVESRLLSDCVVGADDGRLLRKRSWIGDAATAGASGAGKRGCCWLWLAGMVYYYYFFEEGGTKGEGGQGAADSERVPTSARARVRTRE